LKKVRTPINILENDDELSLFEPNKSNQTHVTVSNKSLHLILTVKELFSILFMRAVVINPNITYSLVRHGNSMYISSSHSVDKHPFFKSKKIHRIRKFMGSALTGISAANPLDPNILCPVLTDQIPINPESSGINAVCPLAYQDDLNLIEGLSIDRREIFDKYGRTTWALSGKDQNLGMIIIMELLI
jgi:hypothetical protein